MFNKRFRDIILKTNLSVLCSNDISNLSNLILSDVNIQNDGFPIFASAQAVLSLLNQLSSSLTLNQNTILSSLSVQIEENYNEKISSEISSLKETINNQTEIIETLSSMLSTLSSSSLIDSNNNFYMPDGKLSNDNVYRFVNSYIEPDTNNVLINTSQDLYIKDLSSGDFIKKD